MSNVVKTITGFIKVYGKGMTKAWEYGTIADKKETEQTELKKTLFLQNK